MLGMLLFLSFSICLKTSSFHHHVWGFFFFLGNSSRYCREVFCLMVFFLQHFNGVIPSSCCFHSFCWGASGEYYASFLECSVLVLLFFLRGLFFQPFYHGPRCFCFYFCIMLGIHQASWIFGSKTLISFGKFFTQVNLTIALASFAF